MSVSLLVSRSDLKGTCLVFRSCIPRVWLYVGFLCRSRFIEPLRTSSLSAARSSARVLTVTICVRSAMSSECAGSPFVLDLVVIVGPTDLREVGHICH